MITSVYMSNNTVRVLTGNKTKNGAAVEKICSLQLKEDCLINGVITNPEALLSELDTFWKEHQLPKKNVYLNLGSSQFAIKQLELPQSGRKKIMQYLVHEMMDNKDSAGLFYDYLPLKKKSDGAKNAQTVMGISVEKQLLDDYVHVFKRIGVRLESIVPIRSNIMKLFSVMPEMNQKSCIVLFLDGNNMTGLLVEKGQFLYSTRVRLYNDCDTPEFISEVLRNISSIQQFHRTQSSAEAVHEICIGGNIDSAVRQECLTAAKELGLEELTFVSDAQFVLPDIDGRKAVFADYLPELGDFVALKEDVNLYRNYKVDSVRKEKQKRLFLYAVPALASFVLLGSLSLGLLVRNVAKMDEINQLFNYLTSSSALDNTMEVNKLRVAIANYTVNVEQGKELLYTIESYSDYNSKVTDEVNNSVPEGMTVALLSYAAEAGTLKLSAQAEELTAINQFIDALNETGLFEQVAYNGYDYQELTGLYTLTVDCTLKIKEINKEEE